MRHGAESHPIGAARAGQPHTRVPDSHAPQPGTQNSRGLAVSPANHERPGSYYRKPIARHCGPDRLGDAGRAVSFPLRRLTAVSRSSQSFRRYTRRLAFKGANFSAWFRQIARDEAAHRMRLPSGFASDLVQGRALRPRQQTADLGRFGSLPKHGPMPLPAKCPHCGAFLTFPGFDAIYAFVCKPCGEPVEVNYPVQ
jgi:hypothetical protein